MRIAGLLLSTIFFFFSSYSFANPNSHTHAGRAHSHPLPTQGLAHKHGNGALGVALSSTSNTQTKEQLTTKPVQPKKPDAVSDFFGKVLKGTIRGALGLPQEQRKRTSQNQQYNQQAQMKPQQVSRPKSPPVAKLKKTNYSGIRAHVVARLKKDKKIPPTFIDTIQMDYGNGVLIIYNNCSEHEKLNNERIKLEYARKERIRKIQQERNRRRGVYNPMATLNAINNNPFKASFAFKSECSGMFRRVSTLAKTVNGVKEVEISEQ